VHVENLGSDTYLFVDVGSSEPLIVRQEGKSPIDLGNKIGLRPAEPTLHRFNDAGKPIR
jgi:multiple sugar transport system ATP-binding protein